MKYTIQYENEEEYGMGAPVAGDCYAINEEGGKYLISRMAMRESMDLGDGRFIIPLLVRREIVEETQTISQKCVRLAIADMNTSKLHILDTYHDSNPKFGTFKDGELHFEMRDFSGDYQSKSLILSEEKIVATHEITPKFYYKRFWNETRGDMYEAWGTSWWYFETNTEGVILKQLEEYENGIIQCYDLIKPENRFGGLGELPLPLTEFKEYEIFKEDFYDLWNKHNKVLTNDLYAHLKQMQPRPALYLGETSITALWHYVSGYTSACYFKGMEEELTPRFELFHEFAKRKTGFYESTSGWKHMILSHCEGDETKALDLFFDYFDEFLKGEELNEHLKSLVPKNKHDMDFDKVLDFHWYGYKELKPIIPELLTWLQDINWPVARPISAVLKPMLPDILPELIPILEGDDAVWKYHILQVFFIETKSEHYLKIKPLLEQLAYQPSAIDEKEEVSLLAKEILEKHL
ncbi:MAG: DUF5071 domain-containing protein [Saprospiraceae bacterium]|nr:DUF5071 domain-containing protein [Saprospiraceae bacterium]